MKQHHRRHIEGEAIEVTRFRCDDSSDKLAPLLFDVSEEIEIGGYCLDAPEWIPAGCMHQNGYGVAHARLVRRNR